MPLSGGRPGRGETRLAILLAGLMMATAAVSVPLAATALGGGAAALAAYATAVLMVDVMTAVLLLSMHAARPSRAILVLSLGYLFTGLAAVPWVLTFPGVFSETGLLGAGLQTTAVIAAGRRIGFPVAILAYAVLSRAENGRASVQDSSAVATGLMLTLAAVAALTVLAIAEGDSLPPLMLDARMATAAWDVVPTLSAFVCVTGIVLLWRRGPA